mmetsp:Transcript_22848/g.41909  ORF Transcript_22848/g.41909 Transcript_22848/m.41909 type:complete len:80 (-) Transcript_22848:435-674(-)
MNCCHYSQMLMFDSGMDHVDDHPAVDFVVGLVVVVDKDCWYTCLEETGFAVVVNVDMEDDLYCLIHFDFYLEDVDSPGS